MNLDYRLMGLKKDRREVAVVKRPASVASDNNKPRFMLFLLVI
jgi:hypothetical protein